VTDLPFAHASFDVVVSQHVQMNVADKPRLYLEARRVLVTGGRLAIWDITDGAPGNLDLPLPWADRPELSHLVSADQLRAIIEAAGFTVVHWDDLTEEAAPFMEALQSRPVGPLTLGTFVEHFAEKVSNLTAGLSSGRLRVIQGVARAHG
jgi:SAM-dependent methyltransferase